MIPEDAEELGCSFGITATSAAYQELILDGFSLQ